MAALLGRWAARNEVAHTETPGMRVARLLVSAPRSWAGIPSWDGRVGAHLCCYPPPHAVLSHLIISCSHLQPPGLDMFPPLFLFFPNPPPQSISLYRNRPSWTEVSPLLPLIAYLAQVVFVCCTAILLTHRRPIAHLNLRLGSKPPQASFLISGQEKKNMGDYILVPNVYRPPSSTQARRMTGSLQSYNRRDRGSHGYEELEQRPDAEGGWRGRTKPSTSSSGSRP